LYCGFTVSAGAHFVNERHVYVRGEEISLEFQSNAEHVLFDVGGWFPQLIRVVNGSALFSFDSSLLRSADYDVRAKPVQDGKNADEIVVFPLTIAPMPNPQRYPVWHWGFVPDQDIIYWTQRGFNGFRFHKKRGPLGRNDKSVHQIISLLEEGARLRADIGLYFHPLLWKGWENREAARCLLPTGQRDTKKVYPLEPEVVKHAEKTVRSWIDRFAAYPSFRHAQLSSEYVTPFCVNDSAMRLAEREAGIDMKQWLNQGFVVGKWGRLNLELLPESMKPENGIIADDNPMYQMLSWWWQRGNGISDLNAMMADIIHAKRDDIHVWHDPYRLSPVYGTHVGLDAISTWTYGHPDIKRLGYTRVLQAAARKRNLKVMQTITLLVYDRFVRSYKKSFADLLLDRSDGKGGFTNGPDYARQAMWLVFSQRPDILSFYYAGRHYPNSSRQSPTVTSPETFDAIGEICRTLVEPYGPAVLQGKSPKAKVAVMMSASAIWFRENPKWYGYPNESILPFCILLMMNHMPFDVLLDDDIADGRLTDYDLLIIPYGDALTHSVHQRIVDFVKKGKTVVADSTLQASIPGVSILDMDFSFMALVDGRAFKKGNALTADEYQRRMEALADQLKPKLSDLSRPFRCKSKQVLMNEVTSGDIQYVFAINDKKIYGPRFGKWKLMQEMGIEQMTDIDVFVTGTPVIYDVLSRTPVEYRLFRDFARFSVTLPPARGKLLAVLPQAIKQVQIIAPKSAQRGDRYPIRLEVLDAAGNLIKGAVPVRIDLTDSAGRKTEYSRYAATAFSDTYGWGFELSFSPAINDLYGEWTIKVAELLSGKTAELKIAVQ
jgi:hypothetical protein